MFNDKYYLTQFTLDGYKTNTRRIEPCCKFIPDAVSTGYKRPEFVGNTLRLWKDESKTFIGFKTRYQVGEVVAISQRYKDIPSLIETSLYVDSGWSNKMFVRSEYMPHQIKIAGIKIERLQDISEEDCIKEGIINDARMWTDENQKLGFNYFIPIDKPFETAIETFASLIDRISGKGTWQRNPYVIAYSFELIK